MTKDVLGDISGGGQCTENVIWWWNQRIKKTTKAEKDAFMKWQQIHELYQVQIKESKTAVAM